MTSEIEISYGLGKIDFQRTAQLLMDSYWGEGRTEAIQRLAFENSVCVIALIDGRQVGFARAHGDRAIQMRIADVIVWPDHRGKGIGKALVRALLDHRDLKIVTTWTLGTADAHGLYEQFGFKPVQPGREMRLER